MSISRWTVIGSPLTLQSISIVNSFHADWFAFGLEFKGEATHLPINLLGDFLVSFRRDSGTLAR